MLRISWDAEPGPVQTLKLEGVLLGPWVGEVVAACARAAPDLRQLRLDVAAVTFVDADGGRLLHDLIRQGVEITACSAYVAELLGERQ